MIVLFRGTSHIDALKVLSLYRSSDLQLLQTIYYDINKDKVEDVLYFIKEVAEKNDDLTIESVKSISQINDAFTYKLYKALINGGGNIN